MVTLAIFQFFVFGIVTQKLQENQINRDKVALGRGCTNIAGVLLVL